MHFSKARWLLPAQRKGKMNTDGWGWREAPVGRTDGWMDARTHAHPSAVVHKPENGSKRDSEAT